MTYSPERKQILLEKGNFDLNKNMNIIKTRLNKNLYYKINNYYWIFALILTVVLILLLDNRDIENLKNQICLMPLPCSLSKNGLLAKNQLYVIWFYSISVILSSLVMDRDMIAALTIRINYLAKRKHKTLKQFILISISIIFLLVIALSFIMTIEVPNDARSAQKFDRLLFRLYFGASIAIPLLISGQIRLTAISCFLRSQSKR